MIACFYLVVSNCVFEKIVVVLVLVFEDADKVRKCLIENYHLVDLCHSSGFFVGYFHTVVGFDKRNLRLQSSVGDFV